MHNLDKLLEKLNEAIKDKENLKFDYGFTFRHINFSTKRYYQGIFNNILLAISAYKHKYSLPCWIGFHQAKNLKISILKGSKGTPIIVNKYYNIYKKNNQRVEITEQEALEDPTIEVIRQFYNTAEYVFNIQQTDANPEDFLLEPNPQYDEIDKLLMDYCQREQIEIVKGNKNSYLPKEDKIRLVDKTLYYDLDCYYSSFAHECAHSTGAEHRLNRELICKGAVEDKTGIQKYSQEEVVAELASVILTNEYGIEHLDYSAAYISSFLQTADIKEIWKISSIAHKAAIYIKGGIYEN